MKKYIAVLSALLLCGTILSGCGEKGNDVEETYTYNIGTTALGSNWNPHTWETTADDAIVSYITTPFCSMSILDSENGVYQWIYEMAESITDVTKDNRGDLTRFQVTLQEGKTAETTDAGFVFEIRLNRDAKWEDGTPINADSYIYSMQQLLNPRMKNYRANLYVAGESALAGAAEYYYADSDEVSYDTVGCYKVDDYTIRYVTKNYIDLDYFLTSCTSTWLVYEPLYEAGKDTGGELLTTDYCTSLETTMSCGPYKIESLQPDRQIVYVQNENWYGWERDDEGNLVSYTDFLVDGEKIQQYRTTRIVVDVMEESAMKQAFLKGEISEWTPSADELTDYASSEQLYRVDETYTMSFFFNTDADALRTMDTSGGNTNSVVLSNADFRKAFSLAVDRREFVTATPGYKPAFALMNNLYFYDIYSDPKSSYRGSDEAKQAIVNLYGVEYGEGKAYADLDEAHDSVTGYNLTEAKRLMKKACEELVAAGLYSAGQDIVIRIGWSKAALQTSDNNQIALMNKYINAAADGSGFGRITLEAVGSIEDRYGAVPAGEYAIGYGAWGGAAFYPFRNMQVYCDNSQYEIHEAACWDPSAELLTLSVNGEEVIMSWKDWSNALIGSGRFTEADNKTKLAITAQLEQRYLEKYYRIPVCGTTVCTLLSYKNSYYTDEYNIMYGFGGLRLMTYNYSDREWAELVREQGSTLSYE